MDPGTRATIPIFPLANVVLFPKLRVPLYIFEPRYRQMTQEALDADRRIGMVTVKPEFASQTAGDPPVFPTGCEGVIIQSECLPDGGYNIVLLGTHRFQIRSELPPVDERLYRVAEVELIGEATGGDAAASDSAVGHELDASDARATTIELLRQLMQHTQPEADRSEVETNLFEAYDDELFVNSLAQSLNFSAPEKQGLIECNGVRDRLHQLVTLLQFRLAAIRSGQSGSAPMQ